MDAPINFNEQAMHEYFNVQPSSVKGSANRSTEYYKRYLFTMIYSVYKFTIPKHWALNFFRYWLFQYGSIGVVYTKKLGWIASPYGVSKVDYQYQPKVINVTNKELNDVVVGVIGVNAGVVKTMDDYWGLNDLVTEYAQKLASIDKAIDINLMNANVTKAFRADDKKQADTIKRAYSEATEGKPFIVVNKDVLGEDKGLINLFGSVKNDFIVGDLLTAKRTIINEFLTRIGIKNANYDKKERLNSQEVEQNNDETSSIVSVIYANIKDAFERINTISGLGLKVELSYNYSEGGLNSEYD